MYKSRLPGNKPFLSADEYIGVSWQIDRRQLTNYHFTYLSCKDDHEQTTMFFAHLRIAGLCLVACPQLGLSSRPLALGIALEPWSHDGIILMD